MYAIYGNSYHQYTPNVSIYTSTMDPMCNNSPTWNKATDLPFGRPGRLPPRKQEPEIRPFGDDLPKYYLYIISIFT